MQHQQHLARSDIWLLLIWLVALGCWLAVTPMLGQPWPGRSALLVGCAMLALAAFPIQAACRGAIVSTTEAGLAQRNAVQLAASPLLPLLSSGYNVSLLELDVDGRVVNAGPGADQIWPDQSVVGTLWLDHVAADHRASQAELLLAARHGNTSCGQCEVQNASCSTVAFAIHQLGAERITVLVRPIDVYLNQLRETQTAAETDTLSGLLDRVAFLREATGKLQTGPDSGRWCLMNCEMRVLAHADAAISPPIEDRLWREAAARIAKGVDHDALVGRTGNNQLSILLAVADDEAATRKARSVIADGVATTEDSQGWKPQIGVRVGLAILRPGQTCRSLISDAESALVQSLQHQWGTVMTSASGVVVSELQAPTRGKVLVGGQPRDLTSLMRADRSAEVFFEPVAHLATGAVAAVQLHVRWRSLGSESGDSWLPDASMLPQPDQVDLDRRCLRAGLNHVASWRSGRWPKLALWFPVSARTLVWQDFPTYVQHCLANTATPPAALTLALAVTDLAEDKPALRHAVQRVREVGIKVAVQEDNNDGSLLDALRLHAVDTVMLGERFVTDAGHQARTMALLTSLVSMTFDLGAAAAASGVHTTAQARLLRRLGVNYVSGPLCGEPMPTRSINEGLAAVTSGLAALKSETPIVALARNKADTINLTD